MEQQFSTQLKKDGSQVGEGFCSPSSLDTVQCFSFTPERVIPIIFLPGIMGSILRLTEKQVKKLKAKKNIVWNPDDSLGMLKSMGFGGDPVTRQLLLDPDGTEANIYPGDPESEEGKAYLKSSIVAPDRNSPFFGDDLKTNPKSKSAKHKACERGWGEVMFSAYGKVINRMEVMMNTMFGSDEKLNPAWKDIIDDGTEENDDGTKKEPKTKTWGATTELPPVTEKDLETISKNCCYPVHVIGYNWIRSNGEQALIVRDRIKAIMQDYNDKKRCCEKVIVVTHSMGGLVARAMCHPDIGGFQNTVLGIVHGVQPAIGSGACYRRMLAGFDTTQKSIWQIGVIKKLVDYVTSFALGGNGERVTPILANGWGGMELLPNKRYGNGWLKVVGEKGQFLRKDLPEQGDPYGEIYTKEAKKTWWGLLREEWINPAKEEDKGLDHTRKLLGQVEKFHDKLMLGEDPYYHPLSYAHYGNDPGFKSFHNVVWEVSPRNTAASPYDQEGSPSQPPPKALPSNSNPDSWRCIKDDAKGEVSLELSKEESGSDSNQTARALRARIRPSAEPGDQTVPVYSADDQLRSGKFAGIFPQTGYEHSVNYLNETVIRTTLYCVVQIALKMKWECGG
ncbi:MAG: GPI inositol-deacylase [Proteobacteria bacterium]|nr:GPI inositol-deacylase [Pseudomonadota bacterium]